MLGCQPQSYFLGSHHFGDIDFLDSAVDGGHDPGGLDAYMADPAPTAEAYTHLHSPAAQIDEDSSSEGTIDEPFTGIAKQRGEPNGTELDNGAAQQTRRTSFSGPLQLAPPAPTERMQCSADDPAAHAAADATAPAPLLAVADAHAPRADNTPPSAEEHAVRPLEAPPFITEPSESRAPPSGASEEVQLAAAPAQPAPAEAAAILANAATATVPASGGMPEVHIVADTNTASPSGAQPQASARAAAETQPQGPVVNGALDTPAQAALKDADESAVAAAASAAGASRPSKRRRSLPSIKLALPPRSAVTQPAHGPTAGDAGATQPGIEKQKGLQRIKIGTSRGARNSAQSSATALSTAGNMALPMPFDEIVRWVHMLLLSHLSVLGFGAQDVKQGLETELELWKAQADSQLIAADAEAVSELHPYLHVRLVHLAQNFGQVIVQRPFRLSRTTGCPK